MDFLEGTKSLLSGAVIPPRGCDFSKNNPRWVHWSAAYELIRSNLDPSPRPSPPTRRLARQENDAKHPSRWSPLPPLFLPLLFSVSCRSWRRNLSMTFARWASTWSRGRESGSTGCRRLCLGSDCPCGDRGKIVCSALWPWLSNVRLRTGVPGVQQPTSQLARSLPGILSRWNLRFVFHA